ncbi:MAG: hypothetical protein H7138_21950 [Myxococcales bacterium]|nr:hypothetical protein [Myxococcales bacterium]
MKKPTMDRASSSVKPTQVRVLSLRALSSALGGREWIDAGAPEVVASPPRG